MGSDLSNQLQSMAISNIAAPKHLLFDPSPEQHDIRQGLEDVPPYLFHVHHDRSVCKVDHDWAKSMDACATDAQSQASAQQDLLCRDNREVEGILNKHLRWRETTPGSANLVSWTSSLLYALRYICQLHYRGSRDSKSVTFLPMPLENIHLCVVRTKDFDKGVFIRDSYLIKHYKEYSPLDCGEDLAYFDKLRHQVRDNYYFGEFLSQGALKITDRCEMVCAMQLKGAGLFDCMDSVHQDTSLSDGIMPPMCPTNTEKNWAKWVLDDRKRWDRHPAGEDLSEDKQQAVAGIAALFGQFSAPMAAAIICLRPRNVNDQRLARIVKSAGSFPTDITQGRWASAGVMLVTANINASFPDMFTRCSTSTRNIPVDNLMPELLQFGALMLEIARVVNNEQLGVLQAVL
ncbi:hypothetical protein RB597_008292 [Gaeumannomyces tritici]